MGREIKNVMLKLLEGERKMRSVRVKNLKVVARLDLDALDHIKITRRSKSS